MMHHLIEGFANQLKKAIEIGKAQKVSAPTEEIRNIVVAGLGGSGIGGSLVEHWLSKSLKVPFYVTKSYDVPAFIDKHTLFIASSFSGGTEETLIALRQVLPKKAKFACVTSGGELMNLAQNTPFDAVQIPNEAPCPRAFLGYSFVQLLYLLKNYQLIDNSFEAELEEAVQLIEQQKEAIHTEAKALAKAYKGKLPIVYADDKFLAVITRLQQQINENAKQLCHINIFPEMNHNELVGWELPKEMYKNTVVTMLRTPLDHPRVQVRMDICEPIFEKQADELIRVVPQGKSFIEQSIYLIHLFDWVSFYLAELNQVDPFPVDIIGHLKGELAKVD